MNNKKYMGLLGLLFPMGMMAQSSDVNLCDFETEDSYASVGVYDTWEHSPFRTGELQGNCKVIDNFLNQENEAGVVPNPSSKILAVQRSRFGSNTFGALVKLKEPFAQPRDQRYIHVNMWTPKGGNVMVIGLGNRDDRPWQPELTEQFWAQGQLSAKAGEWCDVVFPFSGATGVTIRYLLIVVDRNSRHDMNEDFAAYIDNIVLSDSSIPLISTAVYGLNYDENTTLSRTDRYVNTLTLATSDGTQNLTVSQQSNKLLYQNKMDFTFTAKPGTTITPTVAGALNWMAGYTYIDKGNDGKFDVAWSNSGITEMGDLMSYSLFKNVDSKGVSMPSSGPSANAPAFTVPADMQPGFYRLRYKVDWDCVDPAGNNLTNQTITANGGVIIDARINIHADNVNLTRTTTETGGGLNGSIAFADGSSMDGKTAPWGQQLAIKAEPAPGFVFDKVVIRHGYNLNNEKDNLYGNKQWEEFTVTANEFTNGTYTIAADKVDGDIQFLPYFVSDPTAVVGVENGASFTCVAGQGVLTLNAPAATKVVVADVQGHNVFNAEVEGTRTLNVAKGVYIVNGKKVIVK